MVKKNEKEEFKTVYLLVGENDDLTPKEQVLNAEEHLGTEKSEILPYELCLLNCEN